LFSFHNLIQISIQGGNHRRCLWLRCFYGQFHASVFNSFKSVAAKGAYQGTIEFILRNIIKQTLYTTGGKKANDIKIIILKYGLDISTPGAIHKGKIENTFILFQPVYNITILLIFGTYIKETLRALMFVDYI